MDRNDPRSSNVRRQAARAAKRFRPGGRRSPLFLIVGTAVVAVAILVAFTVALPAHEASANPAGVLTLAGKAAAKQPDAIPHPDQYWYVAESGGYQAWISMDGAHDSLVISNGQHIPVPACRNGMQSAVPSNPQQPEVPCVADPGYLPDAPSSAVGMKAYLLKRTRGDTAPDKFGGEVMTLLQFHYLRPTARAALFQVAATMSGLKLKSPGTDGLSADQVAVSWQRSDGTTSLVFDAHSHGFVGLATGSSAGVGVSGPTFGVVDHIGELP